uniref:TC1D2 protein n=1 Tax=Pavo cristatus TaxID=9049 RepID=A0A8C9ESK2_PAVCR
RGNDWWSRVMGELGSETGNGSTYSLRPGLQRKLPAPLVALLLGRFKASTVKECIRAVLKEKLADVQYVPEEIPQLTKSLSEIIKDRLKEQGFERYKMVVQVVIGEQRGEGVNMAARCFWDADTDSYAHDVFMNDSLFCVVAAFGCFYY